MTNGWEESAGAWIAAMGARGDWAREYVLDPAMLARLHGRWFDEVLDVGCGEGRFCRMLKDRAGLVVGLDPTTALLDEARQRDPAGRYLRGRAEHLPFPPASFDLVVSYLTLIDIPDFRAAIAEMARVLRPGGTLLVANLTGLVTAGAPKGGWVTDASGRRLHYPVDNYLTENSYWDSWDGIRIQNWHRPLSAYMQALLNAGLQLIHFDEPEPVADAPDRRERYRRVPWFLLMEWRRPAPSGAAAGLHGERTATP